MSKCKGAEAEVWKGLAADVIGGLVASWAMNQFQGWLGKLMEGTERPHGAQSLQQGSPDHGIGRELQERGSDEEKDDAAVRVASAISENIFDHHLTKSEKETGGAVAHYAMGVTSGALYGVVAEILPEVKICAGLPFGAAGCASPGSLERADGVPTSNSCLCARVAPCFRGNDRSG